MLVGDAHTQHLQPLNSRRAMNEVPLHKVQDLNILRYVAYNRLGFSRLLPDTRHLS